MRRLSLAMVAGLLLLSLTSCTNSSDKTSPSTTTTSTTAATSTTAGPHGHNEHIKEGTGTKVKQYWIRGHYLSVGSNFVDETKTPLGAGAVEALLGGAPRADAISGMTTLIPEGTKLLGLDISDGTATVDLSKEFVSGGGTMSMQVRTAQVVFTLTQFPSVNKVVFHIEGEEPEGLGGEGLPTTYTSREEFDDILPRILVESPTPYQNTKSPITVAGMANVSADTVHWAINTTEGSPLGNGSSKVTNKSPKGWASFEFQAKAKAYKGNVVLSVWEQDGEKESDRTNIYDVLVNLT